MTHSLVLSGDPESMGTAFLMVQGKSSINNVLQPWPNIL